MGSRGNHPGIPGEHRIGIRTLVVGPLECNCYILSCGTAAAVIDPGGDAETILNALADGAVRLTHIINTHGHIDHIAANGDLKRRFPGAAVSVHLEDAPMLTSPSKNLSFFLGKFAKSPPADLLIDDGARIEPYGLRVLHTPGHTPGSVSLYLAEQTPPVVFGGDTLFAGGIGRTDFPGGSHRTLLRSIREILLSLPTDTLVLPGHGPATTVGAEAISNPFL